jgi:hypothetical protein
LIANATSGDALEAQNIILRRMALEGDVVPSRVPPPLNITQIGGYINLLTSLNETAMRSQVLAGILGVAGPSNQAGWLSPKPLHHFRMLENDRPSGPAQATLPTVVPIRSDFWRAVSNALKELHAEGCSLPLLGTPMSLPTKQLETLAAVDPLPYLGRVLWLAAATAFADPTSDPLVLARAAGSTDLFQVAANSLQTATVPVTAGNYDALKANGASFATVPLSGAKLVYVNPVLAAAGFYPASPWPQPAAANDVAWSKFTNVAGLVPGRTHLGDELALLYGWVDITASIFAPMVSYVWNGTSFVSS